MKSELKVKLVDIGENGYQLRDTLDPEFFGLTPEDHLHFIAPVKVEANLTRTDDAVFAQVYTSGRFASFCYRTFEPVERDWKASFVLDFKVDRNTQVIDLADDIRQEVIVDLPMRVLSDAEEAKEAKLAKKKRFVDDDEGPEDLPDTYQPFKNL